MSGLDELHTWAGAYVLGALDHEDRVRFEHHLEACERCRVEIAELSPLPGLLARAEPVRGDDGDVDVAAGAVDRILADAARLRRSRSAWRAVSVAALIAVVVVVGFVLWPEADDGEEVYPLAVAATDVPGAWASVTPRQWGTEIAIGADMLPRSEHYVLVAIDEDGTQEIAATWGPTDGALKLRGAAALSPGALAEVAVFDSGGHELFTAAPTGAIEDEATS